MTVEYIRYQVTAGQRKPFIEAYKNAFMQLDESEFCKAYEITECEEQAGQFIVRIEWTSSEDHINGFRKSQVFPAFFANVKPFYNNIQEMRHYKLTDVSKRK